MTEIQSKTRRLGYARVSTYGQTLDAQLEQLKAEGCTKVYREKASGAQPDRRELLRMVKHLARGDGDAYRPLGAVDLRPVCHRQADRGRQGTIPVTG